MIIYLTKNNILDRITVINHKLKDNQLTSRDLIKINRIKELITTFMIQSKERIKKSKFNHPSSPTLAISILTVKIWKLKFNAVNNKRENHHTVLKIYNKIIDIGDNDTPFNIESKDKKYIQNELKLAFKQLKNIKKQSALFRKEHLMLRTDEAKLTGNKTLASYIRRII